jgi:putative component of toxin-antitoxin plasmid stabilization module
MLGHVSATREAHGGVLVVGGGFAGGYVARELGDRGATIVILLCAGDKRTQRQDIKRAREQLGR